MKTIAPNPLRRAWSVLATGLILGGMFAATAQTLSLPPQTNQYRMASNYVSTAVMPYGSGGGVPAQSIQTGITTPGTNFTLTWYGMQGWYSIQATTNIITGPWITLATVESSAFNGSYTGPRPDPTNSYSFILAQDNSYAGSDQCGSCHGDKYTTYLGTTHAGVFSNPYALTNFTLNCLTVGYGQPTGFTNATSTPNLENVGCEDCHGPAGWHKNSDHDVILPAVSLDPDICGSCHQGPLHPTFQEYTTSNYVSTSVAPMGILTAGRTHSLASTKSGACQVCHAANQRMVMINEYYDNLAGSPHPLTLFPSQFSGAMGSLGAAACATCHDPHSSNYVHQLRFPTSSTNYNHVVPLLFTTTAVVTNYNGTFTTNSLTMNYVFDQYFNPTVQVCGQCHSGGGGLGGAGPRWDGETYGYVTNLVASTVTNLVTVPITTNVTVTQVFTNTFYVDVTTNASGTVQVFTNYIVATNGTVLVNGNNGSFYTNGIVQIITNSFPYLTNSYTYTYTVSQYQTNVVTASTNPVVGVGIYYPLIAYTNGGTVYYSSNSLGDYAPHYPVQYNVLIGQLSDDLAARGGPPNVLNDAHTLAPNQCADCHVPNYAVNAGTNVTGHSFVCDYNSPGCVASACHVTYANNPAGLAAMTLNYKISVSNSMVRVVSLLRQWGTNVAPAILATNYGPLSWEYPSISSYFSTKSTNIVGGVSHVFSAGPPKAWNGLGGAPSGTNDNVQLNYVPQDIRIARYSLYWIYEDQSYGVHNPTYVNNLLAWAENDVITNQFIAAGWPTFSANVVSGTHPLPVQFSNTGSGSVYSWTFGDGGTASTSNPGYTYNNPGVYSVTCTVDGKSLTRTFYISVQ